MPTIQERVLNRASRDPRPEPVENQCPHCERIMGQNGVIAVQVQNRRNHSESMSVCTTCIDDHYSSCDDCDEFCQSDDMYGMSVIDGDDRMVCPNCYSNYGQCNNCGNRIPQGDMLDGYCSPCSERSGHIAFRNYRDNTEKYQSEELGTILKSKRIFGVELEIQLSKQEYASKCSRELEREVGVTSDGSISGLGIEIITPQASGKKGEELIERVCTTINKSRAKVDKTCGMHVHINVADIDQVDPIQQFARVKSIWLHYIIFEDIIRSFLSPSRRTNSRYCASLQGDYHFKEIMNTRNMEEIEQIWYRVQNKRDLNQHKAESKHGSRYRGINMHTLFSGRHIEIRYHMGTTVARKVLEWVNLHTRFIDRAMSEVSTYGFDGSGLKEIMNLDLNRKTEYLFAILKLDPSSVAYFRERQEQFATKASEIDKELNKAAKEVLSTEVES